MSTEHGDILATAYSNLDLARSFEVGDSLTKILNDWSEGESDDDLTFCGGVDEVLPIACLHEDPLPVGEKRELREGTNHLCEMLAQVACDVAYGAERDVHRKKTCRWSIARTQHYSGGVKEVSSFRAIPDRNALWHSRCPDNPEFEAGDLPVVASVRTEHWFDPCALLLPDARSEYREEFRERQCGGGRMPRKTRS